MKIIFAGTPEFAAVALRSLCRAGFDIPLVLTQPDRAAGRGLKLHASAVKEYAIAQQIPIAQPQSLRLDGRYPDQARTAHDLLLATPHDLMVVAAYGLILPPAILQIPTHGCLNIHASLLPRWRGAAPIQRAIQAGDATTGVTIMQMEAGLDTGPMLLSEALPISSADTSGSMHDKLAELGAKLILAAVHQLQAGTLHATPQPETGFSYAAKIHKDEAPLDWSQDACILARKIQAFNPAPGTLTQFQQIPIKIWRAQAISNAPHQSLPGSVLRADADGIQVACGNGVLNVTELQKPGAKRLTAAEFITGFALQNGCFN